MHFQGPELLRSKLNDASGSIRGFDVDFAHVDLLFASKLVGGECLLNEVIFCTPTACVHNAPAFLLQFFVF
jgi:hypothetical protein